MASDKDKELINEKMEKGIHGHIPSVEFSLETGKDSLTDIPKDMNKDDVMEDFSRDLEGLLESIDSFKEDLRKAKKIF